MQEALMAATVFLIWGLGAVLVFLLLVSAIQAVAWRLFKDLVGWPVIAVALKEYHAKRQVDKQG